MILRLLPLNLFLAFNFLALPVIAQSKNQFYSLNQIKELASFGDDLGLRIAVKNYLARPQLDWNEWSQIRKLLYENAGVGYDLIFTFEKFAPQRRTPQKSEEIKSDEFSTKGDQAYKEKNYSLAFESFQNAAVILKKYYNKGKIPESNRQLYFYLLHQMGRSLFAVGQFEDSLKIYSSIPKSYYQIRQIQFERMWAAFRTQNFSLAIGAIESQRSPYFSKYMDPESYLVKLYVLKQLCKEKDIKDTRSEVEQILQMLKTNKYSLTEWSKKDIETLSLYYLATQTKKSQQQEQIVGKQARALEAGKIKTRLSNLFEQEKIRLKTSYEKILGFSLITENAKSSGLKNIVQLKKPQDLFAPGLEYWPKRDAEDWLDELGSHYYIGESECKAKVEPTSGK